MKDILIIGKSKAAKNLAKYLKKINKKYSLIRARELDKNIEKIKEYKIVFILTKDDSIKDIYQKIKNNLSKKNTIIHFSGALYFKNIVSLHPIFSFKNKPVKTLNFEKIIFSSENPRYIKTKLNWFKNKIIKIDKEKKPIYHSLLSIYLNFPMIIKIILEDDISKKFKIPKKYLQNIFLENLKHNQLTGPIIRDDKKVIKTHLNSLINTPYYNLYLAILNLWRNYEHK